MSIASRKRQREKSRQLQLLRTQRCQTEGFLTYKTLNMTPSEVFQILTRRIVWLNDKIAWNEANDIPYLLYVKERESIFWIMDKVAEMAKLLMQSERGAQTNGTL